MDTVWFDVDRARRDTPACMTITHFNNAGAALVPTPVLNTTVSHLQREAEIGGYEAEAEAEERLQMVYESAAALIGAGPHEIALVENATRAWDMAFYSFRFHAGDRILTARSEYVSNAIAYLQTARRTGAIVEVVPDDDYGQVSVEALASMIDERVKLVAITHAPTHGGLVNPAADIGRITREAGVPFLLDACQSAGQLPLDVNDLGCDLLSATSRKFLRGPRGAGFLYVRETLLDALEPPFLDLRAAQWTAPTEYRIRDDARRFETWESNVAAKLGMGAAIDYALGWGIEAISERVTYLAHQLRSQIASTSDFTVHDQGRKKSGIVSFAHRTVSSPEIARVLGRQRINVSVSRVEHSQFDLPGRNVGDLVRASVHYYNTEDEISRFIDILGHGFRA